MHITIHAPYQEGRNMVLAGSLHLGTGDELRIEALLSPGTVQMAREKGPAYLARMAEWTKEHVELKGDWGAGPFGRAAMAVLARVGMHPVLTAPPAPAGKSVAAAVNAKDVDALTNLPAVAREDAERLNAANHLLEAPDCETLLNALRRQALHGDRNAWLLLGAVHDAAVCCCNRKQVRNRYDLGWALEQSTVEVPHRIAIQTSDELARRGRMELYKAKLPETAQETAPAEPAYRRHYSHEFKPAGTEDRIY